MLPTKALIKNIGRRKGKQLRSRQSQYVIYRRSIFRTHLYILQQQRCGERKVKRIQLPTTQGLIVLTKFRETKSSSSSIFAPIFYLILPRHAETATRSTLSPFTVAAFRGVSMPSPANPWTQCTRVCATSFWVTLSPHAYALLYLHLMVASYAIEQHGSRKDDPFATTFEEECTTAAWIRCLAIMFVARVGRLRSSLIRGIELGSRFNLWQASREEEVNQ